MLKEIKNLIYKIYSDNKTKDKLFRIIAG